MWFLNTTSFGNILSSGIRLQLQITTLCLLMNKEFYLMAQHPSLIPYATLENFRVIDSVIMEKVHYTDRETNPQTQTI